MELVLAVVAGENNGIYLVTGDIHGSVCESHIVFTVAFDNAKLLLHYRWLHTQAVQ